MGGRENDARAGSKAIHRKSRPSFWNGRSLPFSADQPTNAPLNWPLLADWQREEAHVIRAQPAAIKLQYAEAMKREEVEVPPAIAITSIDLHAEACWLRHSV